MQSQVSFDAQESIDGPLYLIAAKQKVEIAAALERAGVKLTDDLLDSGAVLRVTLGVQKSVKACGAASNVKYAVRRDGETLLELRGSGWTGTCEPLVFDEMSALLAKSLNGGI